MGSFPTMCDHGHALNWQSVYSGSYYCNMCRDAFAGNSYHCAYCQYDLCPKCFRLKKGAGGYDGVNTRQRETYTPVFLSHDKWDEDDGDGTALDESEQKIRELIEREKNTNTMIESMKTENQQNKIEIESLQQEIEILKQLNMKTRKELHQEIQDKDEANQREIARWKQTSSNQKAQIAAIQKTHKQALAEKEAKSQTILDLKKEIESATDRQKQSQIKMNAMKDEIRALKMEAQQRMDEETEEKAQSDQIQNIVKVGMDLEKELSVFKDRYNENKLQEILHNKSVDLLNKDSNLNKDYNGYKENVDKILICSKSFNKYIQDTDEMIKRLTIPDISSYKSWNIDQILLWIKGLEGGRFNTHIDKLRFGFEKSEITGDDLPDLTRGDLAIDPFDIGNFKDRKQLEIYFKSLSNPTPQYDNVAVAAQETEGSITAYVQ